MAIPLSYNLRNLVVRKTTTLMTALGIALTVAVLLSILVLVEGLRVTLAGSGDPLHIIVLRKGSTSELVSLFTRTQFQDLKFKPGIRAGRDGQPLASLEVITVINLASIDNPDGSNVTVRGLLPAGIEMRRNVRLAAGRWFTPGRRELVAGKAVAQRFPAARIGQKIRFGRGEKSAQPALLFAHWYNGMGSWHVGEVVRSLRRRETSSGKQPSIVACTIRF